MNDATKNNKTYKAPPRYSYNKRSFMEDFARNLFISLPDETPEITIDFIEACLGTEASVMVKAANAEMCSVCNGTGVTDKMCTHCAGTGRSPDKYEKGLLGIKKKAVCEICGGTGRIKNPRCPRCEGKGCIVPLRTLKFRIPPGTEDNSTFSFPCMAVSHDRTLTSLIVRIRVREHPVFRRDGCDIRIDLPMSSTVCENGGKVTAPCIDGKAELTIPKGTQCGTVFRLAGKGIARPEQEKRGDMYIRIVPENPL